MRAMGLPGSWGHGSSLQRQGSCGSGLVLQRTWYSVVAPCQLVSQDSSVGRGPCPSPASKQEEAHLQEESSILFLTKLPTLSLSGVFFR